MLFYVQQIVLHFQRLKDTHTRAIFKSSKSGEKKTTITANVRQRLLLLFFKLSEQLLLVA